MVGFENCFLPHVHAGILLSSEATFKRRAPPQLARCSASAAFSPAIPPIGAIPIQIGRNAPGVRRGFSLPSVCGREYDSESKTQARANVTPDPPSQLPRVRRS